jgi:outer membrane lipoprotein SlyB
MKNVQRWKTSVVAALAVLGLGGCANMTPQEQSKATGQIVGGVTGAALGSLIGGGTGRTVAIASGAVIGTVVGGQVGSQQR